MIIWVGEWGEVEWGEVSIAGGFLVFLVPLVLISVGGLVLMIIFPLLNWTLEIHLRPAIATLELGGTKLSCAKPSAQSCDITR